MEFLPEPYSLPDNIPILFLIDAETHLKLAAVGLVPLSHSSHHPVIPSRAIKDPKTPFFEDLFFLILWIILHVSKTSLAR